MKSFVATCFCGLVVGTLAAGCEQRADKPAAVAPAVAPVSQPAVQQGPKVIFLGDSLTAGLGVAGDEAYPAVLARELRAGGMPIQLVNAGVSGDTTAGGVTRLDWLLKQKPAIVVLALGSNDGLRGVKVEAIESNLRTIISRCQKSGSRVLLLGMRIPPNYGPEYAEQFAGIYSKLAESEKVEFVPFLLQGVGGEADLNQADGIHPTAEGHRKLASSILPKLREMVNRASE